MSWWLVPVLVLGVEVISCLAALGQTPRREPETSNLASATASKTNEEVNALKEELARQQNLITVQQKHIDQLQESVDKLTQLLQTMQPKQSVTTGETTSSSTQARAGDQASRGQDRNQVASLSPVIPATVSSSQEKPEILKPAANSVQTGKGGGEVQKSSPLSVRIGDTEFTPSGFMDLTEVFRSTNLGSGIGTAFGSIPYSNTTAGQLTETRFSMQNSRIGLSVTSSVKGFDVKGYVEADFLGNAANTVYITSNSNSLRSRLYWVQARKGSLEILGGQSWSMLTPNRTGLSPDPSDIFYSKDMDTNYQVGLTWARQAQFRVIYHATDTLAAGLSVEDSQQFVGSATLPSEFPVTEVETGSGNPATPNVLPDLIAKVAYDPTVLGKHQHIEVAGLLTTARIFDPVTLAKSTAEGGGGAVNFNLEVTKKLHAILNTFYSDGGGRYIFALGPQFVVRPDQRGALAPAMLRSYSGIAGLEYQATKATQVYAYYGGAYFGRYVSIDPVTHKLIGYGYGPDPRNGGIPSPNTQNREIQEGTFGVIQKFWEAPRYGALQLITQYSYLTRSPWALTPLTVGPPPTFGPPNAHLSMGYVDLRYVLP
jgi:hypothetical protein